MRGIMSKNDYNENKSTTSQGSNSSKDCQNSQKNSQKNQSTNSSKDKSSNKCDY